VTNPAVQSEVDINTNIQTLRSNRLRERVVRSLSPEEVQILQRPYLKNLPPGLPPPSAASALGKIEVNSVPNSLIIAINVSHEDAEAAKIVADRYIQQFMQYLYEEVGGKNDYAVEYLQKRAEQLRGESEAASLKLQQYMQLQKIVSLDESSNLVTARLQAAEGELTRTRLARIELESQYTQVQAFSRDAKNLLEITFIANYGQVPVLKAQQTDLSREQTVLSERYLEKHPKMIEVGNRLTVVQEQLAANIQLAIADMKNRLEKIIDAESNLEREKQTQEKEVFHLRDLLTEYDSLKNQADVKTKNYIEVLDRLNQTRTTSSIDKVPIRVLDNAEVASAPYTPNMTRIVQNCAGLFVVVFLVVAIGLSFIDDRVKSTWDVEHFIGAPLLGIIPELGDKKDDDRHRLVINNIPTPGLESFLSVYSSVKIHSKLDFPKSILVTSTIPGEGKTLVSANLAGSFARHGRKTLLIDCDLRRPMMHHHFSQPNKNGIIPWYEAGADLESNLEGNPNLGIVKIGENLFLLCSGGRSKSPTDILESKAFANLLERLKHYFELIVVDSPPLGAVTDSLLIAERTDEVIYVCRFNRAYRKHIKMYIKALRQGKNELLGIVLNGLTPRRIEYYSNYRYYRSYKKYYGSQT
jgi:capsular exopolysaccharide synthesis family protein